MDFKPFHDYNKMVRRGAAEPLTCEACQGEYVIRIGEDDEPRLECFGCGRTVKPGKRVYDEILKATREYFK